MGIEAVVTAQITTESRAAREVVFSYQRENGTVEHAASIEDAMAICPVLGGMSVEQAGVMLELATLGNEALAKEAAEKGKSQAEQEDTQRDEPVEKVHTEQSREKTKNEKSKIPEPVQAQTELALDVPATQQELTEPALNKPTIKEIISEAVQSEAQKSIEPQVFEQLLPETIDRAVLAELEQQPHHELSEKEEIDEAEQKLDTLDKDVMDSVIDIAQDVNVGQEAIVSLEATQDITRIEQKRHPLTINQNNKDDVQQEVVKPNRDVGSVHIEPQATYTEHTSEPSLILYDDEQKEEIAVDSLILSTVAYEIAAEVVSTYDELITIINEQREFADMAIGITEDLFLAVDNDVDTSHAYQDFETFVSTQPVTEVPMSLEDVRIQANEQPLEQTISQVVATISQETNIHISESSQELAQVIAELREIVLSYSENGEAYPQLTPEITEQLIRLLRFVGYEKPSDALTQCVSTHGYLFLWQAIEYVVNQEKMTELGIWGATVVAVKNDEDIKSRVAKFLFGLIGVLNAEPVT